MSAHTTTMRQRASARWAAAKPIAIALGVGLVAGPIISGILGFQVTRSSAQAATRAAVVEQQAAFCAERARAGMTETGQLDWTRSNELARRFAAMPGAAGAADWEVTSACARKLQG